MVSQGWGQPQTSRKRAHQQRTFTLGESQECICDITSFLDANDFSKTPKSVEQMFSVCGEYGDGESDKARGADPRFTVRYSYSYQAILIAHYDIAIFVLELVHEKVALLLLLLLTTQLKAKSFILIILIR